MAKLMELNSGKQCLYAFGWCVRDKQRAENIFVVWERGECVCGMFDFLFFLNCTLSGGITYIWPNEINFWPSGTVFLN